MSTKPLFVNGWEVTGITSAEKFFLALRGILPLPVISASRVRAFHLMCVGKSDMFVLKPTCTISPFTRTLVALAGTYDSKGGKRSE
jgi:hypothetical protein